MSGEEIQLGPFVGGLDTSSDPTAIADNALAEVINFELSDDGSMKNRPPFEALTGSLPTNTATYSEITRNKILQPSYESTPLAGETLTTEWASQGISSLKVGEITPTNAGASLWGLTGWGTSPWAN